jgi:hypothetical protein
MLAYYRSPRWVQFHEHAGFASKQLLLLLLLLLLLFKSCSVLTQNFCWVVIRGTNG